MKLKKFLEKNRISVTQAALELGINRSYMSNVLNGLCRPSRYLARCISLYTNAEISEDEILGICSERERSKRGLGLRRVSKIASVRERTEKLACKLIVKK